MTEDKYEKMIESGISLFAIFLWSFIIRWLWNLLAVPVLGVKAINYWQAFGLRALVCFLAPARTELWTIKRKLRRLLHEEED